MSFKLILNGKCTRACASHQSRWPAHINSHLHKQLEQGQLPTAISISLKELGVALSEKSIRNHRANHLDLIDSSQEEPRLKKSHQELVGDIISDPRSSNDLRLKAIQTFQSLYGGGNEAEEFFRVLRETGEVQAIVEEITPEDRKRIFEEEDLFIEVSRYLNHRRMTKPNSAIAIALRAEDDPDASLDSKDDVME